MNWYLSRHICWLTPAANNRHHHRTSTSWAREGFQWFKCGRGSCHGLHSRAGDATEEVGVAAVQPNASKRTELGGAIQEAERARGGAVCDGAEPPETRRRWKRSHSRNPSHGLGVAGRAPETGSCGSCRPGGQSGRRLASVCAAPWWTSPELAGVGCEIGRASCRERVYCTV